MFTQPEDAHTMTDHKGGRWGFGFWILDDPRLDLIEITIQLRPTLMVDFQELYNLHNCGKSRNYLI